MWLSDKGSQDTSLPVRSLVAMGEFAAEVRLAMSLPVKLGAGIIMFLLTASGQGI